MNLTDIVIRDIRSLAEKCGIDKVILFGSRARGTHHSKSDIDIAIKGGDADAFKLDAEDEIETLLNIDIVVLTERTSKELLNEIERDGVLIYEKIY